uniref:Uncharacterized protein n=1 Tax=Pristionchus pacificus TaxID=54126 RepID=A0A2A6BMW9_PRIPA|eukprot:PDM67146.1 hypothetical protein PRIPAC_48563 [Pristionchus pacificus]
MAESQVHEHVNNLWSSSSMGDGGSSLFDRYEEDTVANGMGEGAVKEEEMEDIEEEDPFDDVDGSQANRQIAMLNEILAAQSQATIGMSSLITSTSPLDLATLLQATAKEEEGTGEVRPPSSTSSSQCTPTGGASRRGVKREMSEGSASTPDSKRMASNREAANRYRERKKQEMEVMRIEEETLIGRNAELRQMELQVQEEIRQMRDRMTATFGFAPPYEHETMEPSVFEISSCLSLQDRTPKRIPFPKGLMSSLITSTSPLDLATLLQATAKEEEGTGEVRPPSSTSSSQCTPTGGASRRGVKREMSEGSASTPDSKRKASNREAANRYRERKKQEMEVMRIEEETLIGRNAELRQMELQVQEEIRQMRDRMTATFGFAPPYEHETMEPSVFEISSCLSLQDRTPKRIPFPKGLSPAEQNRESVRRDREKKKARFEALKAEEAILAMSKEMLYTQVIKLQGDINHMKQRMRAIGMIVPDITYEY